jgi:hypothetical protein
MAWDSFATSFGVTKGYFHDNLLKIKTSFRKSPLVIVRDILQSELFLGVTFPAVEAGDFG